MSSVGRFVSSLRLGDEFMRSAKHAESGQSLVEFALVLPILALVLMGIIDFARIVSADFIVSEAARDGARYASIGNSDALVGATITSDASVLGSGVQWTVSPSPTRNSGDSVVVQVSDTVLLFDPLLAAILGSPYHVQSSVTMRVE